MFITVAEVYTFDVDAEQLEVPIMVFLSELYRENPKVVNCPQIKFETLILHRISEHDGYVILGENPPLRNRGFVSTFEQDLNVTVRSSADTEVALQRFVLNKQLLSLRIELKGTARGTFEIWKHDGIICVKAEGIADSVPLL